MKKNILNYNNWKRVNEQNEFTGENEEGLDVDPNMTDLDSDLVKQFKEEYGGSTDMMYIAQFVYDNFDKITGLPLEARNEELNFPEEILEFCNEIMGDDNWFDANFEDFEYWYGMIAEQQNEE